MKNQWRHHVKSVDDVFESMSHGEKLMKFIAYDKASVEGHYTVEIHGFVTESGALIITNEKVGRVSCDEGDK